MTTRPLSLWLLALSVLLLAGCGWHLRGSGGPSLEGVEVALEAQSGSVAPLLPALEAQLERAGAVLVDGGQVPTVVLLDQTQTRRALTIAPGGDAREYEVIYQVRFQVLTPEGEISRGPEVVQERGVYSADEEDVLGTESRAEDVTEALRRNVMMLLAARVQAALGQQLEEGDGATAR